MRLLPQARRQQTPLPLRPTARVARSASYDLLRDSSLPEASVTSEVVEGNKNQGQFLRPHLLRTMREPFIQQDASKWRRPESGLFRAKLCIFSEARQSGSLSRFGGIATIVSASDYVSTFFRL